MASQLSPEQAELYVHTVDVYRQKPSHKTPIGGGTDPKWDPTPILRAVPCYRETRPNFDNAELIGRTDEANVFTSDVIHFPILYDDTKQPLDMKANYILKFIASGHPEDGKFLEVLGASTVKNLMANKQKVYVKFTPKPKSFS